MIRLLLAGTFLFAWMSASADAAEINIGYLRRTDPKSTLSLIQTPANNDGIAGARLAIDDNNTTGRFLNQQFSLEDVGLAGGANAVGASIALAERGVSLVGPHRDDIALSLGMLPAKGYASHGESWSFALALRLGSFHLLRTDGVEPVLVLDDVFAELDSVRRERLASGVRVADQVLVTAAVAADVPELLAGRRFTVADGAVTLDA